MANFFSDNKDLQFHLGHPMMRRIVELKERGFAEKDLYDYAPQDFDDAMDSYRRVLEIAGEVCGDVIAPNAEEVDHEGPRVVNDHVEYASGTVRNMKAIVDAGLSGLTLPRKYDGLNFPLVCFVMANEMVARADAGFENIWGLQDCAETLNEFASEEIKQKFLPWVSAGATCAMDLTEPDAGSDLGAVMLKATWSEERQTWLLNGVKRFITNGDGDVSLVLARTEEGTTDARGLSMLVYDKRDGGVKVRRIENKLGIKGSPTCELVFTNAPAQLVGDRKMGLIKYVMSLMNAARLGIGAQSVGLCEAAYREALKYAQEREQFGKPIIRFAAVSEMLSNMKAKLQGARALLYETTRFVEIYKQYTHISHERSLEPEERQEMKFYNRLADGFTPLVKLFSSEYANQLAYDAVQIHGGSGFMKDYPCERLYRDARIMNIYEGTSQLQVVAAINAVTKGTFMEQIERYAAGEYAETMRPVVAKLRELTVKFSEMVARVEAGDKECAGFKDFHARRLVETAGHIIISYLLARQAGESEEYAPSARIFSKLAEGKIAEAYTYVMNSPTEDVGLFRDVERQE
ncbi:MULTISPECIES: acyl-CoA dehydrogenase family protein [Alistipes]|uniref:acyl-CoA dehydrogenase family protein n=1 Tax=Alistipes TaxID=239759 RepID=UPI001B36D8D5|nr:MULTISPECIES: acyl-CoA dehydrogenase family protein [Alistipes]MBQ4902451.1 acyl-CoA dehydrogenase family protein [Alistipes sp. Marseille-P2263]MBS5643097.1 acyl-CoA dehydrogenase family protein [Alistipes sp.]MCI2257729.1 acyl-CoA dehydrogenase family protein [Alistipes dispar]HJC20034.1 acyl-CoA dehydrogenase family protein [Candidatus Alistipes stercoripullorum]